MNTFFDLMCCHMLSAGIIRLNKKKAMTHKIRTYYLDNNNFHFSPLELDHTN